ncbi:MAG TPA: manganese efflux pump [Syntrophomonadaceae bacterium]|nr:manganese efflux pump [Syntrophomonadaceae bacterium]HQA06593.1 manganese efflux pump [Syntrophomonadaceae bacterium]HQE22334.1 manganese efflux pump [Syntrophomonadaceae bacterium]
MIEQYITIILVAIVLGLDAFSLSLGMGLKGVTRSFETKFVSTVGILHVIMPLIGLGLGAAVGRFLGVWAARVGALVLAYIALDLLLKGYRQLRPRAYKFSEAQRLLSLQTSKRNFSSDWWSIIVLGVSVSIDALTVGFGLGTLRVPVFFTVILMGATAAIMTVAGFAGGRVFGRLAGSYAQLVGGVILMALAIKWVL